MTDDADAPTAAILVLADGTCFEGIAIGSSGTSVGEVVFNTAMTGYQEILTDPSYAEQIVTLTYPHIGNTGANAEDRESTGKDRNSTVVHAKGLVIRDLPLLHSNFRAEESLASWLERHGVVAIADIDTRALTRKLRDEGAMPGCIAHGTKDEMYDAALAAAKGFPGLAGMDLAREVSCVKSYVWQEGSWALGAGYASIENARFHVVAMDFGVKCNILRLLADRGCRITVVPATTSAEDILALEPDGVFLSNGPGDPEPCDYAIEAIRRILAEKLPVFGICLGHQLLALASGAATMKMKFGHHGANHPVLDTATGRVMISSQNHGFAVDADTLGNELAITHVSLFDRSLQGIRRLDVPAFGFQGHPEASPGPHDVEALFDEFIDMMKQDSEARAGAEARV
ncbi:MAG: carbamoyl-phosphate synthase small subunit [Gammaproteobacteria bacterium]|nr:MAG: carbamoyl-phosphate synthase small subunit [Gammaproteobacteria bacterium]PIE35659.1 MAG: carbamoyl-phosphate synthase small subunit [Gammaproteobacteria bacterium]